MAPEFFIFIFAMLLAGAIPVAGLTALFWKRARKLLLIGCAGAGLLLLTAVWIIRQEYFLNEPLAIAAGAGDLAKVKALLGQGASPNAYGIDGVGTALGKAANSGHKDIVLLLLERGAKPNKRDASGMRPLSQAKAGGDQEIIQLLIQAGAKE